MNEDLSDSSQGKRKGGRWILAVIIGLVILAAGIYGGTYLVKQKPTWFGLPMGTEQAQAEAEAIITKASKLIVLPSDEIPTIATVTDVSAVKEQAFFKNAQNGDRVLIYQNAGKAILFRESENKIIEVGAVNFNQETASPTVAETSSPTVKPTLTPAASPSALPVE